MRPPTVFANGPSCETEKIRRMLRGRWRRAARAVMVLASLPGMPAAEIAALLGCHPATVRRWIARFNAEGIAGLADRPRPGRPVTGGSRLPARIAGLLERPGPWTLLRIWRYLGRPHLSGRMLYRRVRQVAAWRRPKLVARGGPEHDQVVANTAVSRTGPPTTGLCDLPRPFTGSAVGHRRALDQPLAAAGLRTQLLECRLAGEHG